MDPRHHITNQTLFDYAAGTASEAAQMLVESHLVYCAACCRELGMLGVVSGALFASIEPDPLSIITKSWEKIQDDVLLGQSKDPEFIPKTLQSNIYPFTDDGAMPDPFIKSVGIGPEAIPWQTQGEGVSYLQLPFASKKAAQGLYKMAPGTIVETHNHDMLEMVLVFQGGIRDDRSEYWPGDLMITPPNYSHELEVIGNDECMYLLMFDDEGEIELT